MLHVSGMSEPNKPEPTLREHMKRIRGLVPAASCARNPEKMRAAARKRWDAVKKDKAQLPT